MRHNLDVQPVRCIHRSRVHSLLHIGSVDSNPPVTQAVAVSRVVLAALLQGNTGSRVTAIVVEAVLASNSFHTALSALACELVAATRQQVHSSFVFLPNRRHVPVNSEASLRTSWRDRQYNRSQY